MKTLFAVAVAVATSVWAAMAAMAKRKRERKIDPVAVNAAGAAMIDFAIVLKLSHQNVTLVAFELAAW